MQKAIFAGIAASVMLLSACGADANGGAESTSAETADDSAASTGTIPESDSAATSGENDPRPPAEVDKPSSGAAFGVSETEAKARIASANEKQQGSAEIFKDVDFLNFTYEVDGFSNLPFEVKDGEFFDEENRLFFSVSDIQYGDIGGDESPEAVIYVLYNAGGTGQFTDVLVYGLDGSGQPVKVAMAGVGDRGFGGIESGEIKDGKLLLTRFEGTVACCPVSVATYVHRDWQDGQLRLVGEPKKEAFVSFDGPADIGSYESDPRELRFLPGTSSARVFGSGDSEPLKFEASKGQELKLTFLSEIYGEASLLLKDAERGKVLGELTAGEKLSVTLESDGDYVLTPSTVRAELDDFAPGFEARIEIV